MSSSWALGRQGELVVMEGAIIHIDCIADRKKGNPGWVWTNRYKEYPTGWLGGLANTVSS